MRKHGVKRWMTMILAGAFSAAVSMTALADNQGINGGAWLDGNNLTWETNDGTVTTFGRGPVFADEHPEITDPEYFLKEAHKYPGDDYISYNSKGELKQPCSDEALKELQNFVHSFDWIHSDEWTRANMAFERIANGLNGNYYGRNTEVDDYRVLLKGYGVCEDFSDDFERLCNYVGLECVTYLYSLDHQNCLLKIGEQWFACDPTNGGRFISNAALYPVDFETEYHRAENEFQAKIDAANAGMTDDPEALSLALTQKALKGEITTEEYEAEMQKLWGWDVE